jgi:hypothetical protein
VITLSSGHYDYGAVLDLGLFFERIPTSEKQTRRFAPTRET